MRTKSESRAIVFSTDVVLGDVIVDWLKNIADLKGTRRETLGLHENGGEVELAVVCGRCFIQ